MHETPNRDPQRDRPPILAGRYVLVRTETVVGHTAAVVGYDARLKRWRTIQIARPGDERAAAEIVALAQHAAKLEHAALERIIDVGNDGKVSFVVRDRLVGSVADHLARHGAVSPVWAVRVVARVAEGLAWAHARGVIHGHPRPDVVRFAEDGAAVLTGFGLEGVVEESTRGRAAAPYAHLAPELRQRWRPDVPTDIYALGALLYTLLAGRHSSDLFYAETYEGLLTPVPRVLRPVLLRACAYEPSERFSAAGELQEALLSRIGKLPAPDDPDPPWLADVPPQPEKPSRLIAYDPLLAEIARSLGTRPTAAQAKRIDESFTGGTLDPETGQPLPYVMSTIDAKDPGFRDPFEEVDESELPDYVDKSLPIWRRKPPEQKIVKEDGSVEDAPEIVATSGGGGTSRRIVQAVLGLALVAVLALALMGGSVGVAWYLGTSEVRSEQALLDSVEAESAWFASMVSGDPELEPAWYAIEDAPPDKKGEAAAELVRLLEERVAVAPAPASVEASIERLGKARDAWEKSR